jgi:3-oxoacyl-[acyl-carrier protein] reductase
MSHSVLLTGGNRGIGLGIARAFAKAGDKVAITYRTGDPPTQFFATRCDVRDADSVAAAFSEVRAQQGPVEVLIANAGITRDGLLVAMEDKDFLDVMDTNLMGAARCAKEAAQDMIRGRWGRIIFISSTSGFQGSPGQANYTASKAALLGLARTLAWELGRRNITANVVAPGYIDTDMTRAVSEKRRTSLLGQIPMGRMGTVDEVIGIVQFLAGNSASYITGALVPVGGGLAMGW